MSDAAQSEPPEPGPKLGSIAFYAREYDASERTVKRWNATGLSKQDRPPLENPEGMLAWWSRIMTQRVPDGITAAVVRWRVANKSTPAPVSAELPLATPEILIPEDKAAVRQALLDQPIDESELGDEQVLRRLQENEVRLSRIATQPGVVKDYVAVVARLGPAMEKVRKENMEQRKLILKAEAEAAIQSLHIPIKNETYLLDTAMCAALGIPLTPEVQEKWRAECDRLFHRLKETVFAA